MNICKSNLFFIGLTISCLTAVDIIAKPVFAKEPPIETINSIQSLSNSYSTNANDLVTNNQLAQAIRDLDKFCTNYPYNSQCKGRSQPDTGLEATPSQTNKSTSSRSETTKSGWAIAPEVSTLGLGGSVVRKITPNINARAGINAFGYGFELEDTDATYDANLKLLNISTVAEYHPFKSSGFRLSGGLVFGNNSVEGTATPTGSNNQETIEIGDQTFNADQLASVDVDVDITNSVSPYLGVGWGNPVSGNKGLGFWANLGVVFGGSPEVNISPNVAQGVPNQVRQQIDDAVAQETEDIKDEINFVSVYPVATLGLSYQF